MHLHYTTERITQREPGVNYANPRYFRGQIDRRATSVSVDGHWPTLAAAYEAAGVPVETPKTALKVQEDEKDRLLEALSAAGVEGMDRRYSVTTLQKRLDEVQNGIDR